MINLQVFCSELPVFMREHRNGMYRTDVYFLCKTLAELPLFVFLPVLFTSVCYYMVWLNPNILRFLTACVVVTLVANAATSFGKEMTTNIQGVPLLYLCNSNFVSRLYK